MVEVWIPYGITEVCLTAPAENFLGTIEPKLHPQTPVEAEAELRKALENPLRTPRLRELVKAGDKVAIAIDGDAEFLPLQALFSLLREELKEGGVLTSDITVFFGRGLMKPPTSEWVSGLLGEAGGEMRIEVHDPSDAENLVELGTTSYRTRVFVNRRFSQADVKIALGRIGLHTYAGYSGGAQAVLNAVGGLRTLQHNYSLAFDPRAEVGRLAENPVHLDGVETARMVGVDFAVNLLTDEARQPLKAFAGSLEASFHEGVEAARSLWEVPVGKKAGIIAVSPGGHPYDVSLYEAQDALLRVMGILDEEAVVVFAAECSQGFGGFEYLEWIDETRTLDDVRELLRKGPVYGFHKVFQLRNSLQKARVIAVTALPENITSNLFGFRTARSVGDAMETAFRLAGRKSKVWVVPRAMKVLPVFSPQDDSAQG
ncbi:nickel-dependent lactate racemase [Candidatus Hecatella orcuttiae]|jgi:nickel-dependent lactate racemase|uniref:nickel-dependent lactate racemase n=1 Tax=Candidatus Hecatella orcuttiae TaxID=1935119 RepID=UPI0028680A93|nr:nickel-dependent lactate racemase [Candidatus Hecatella orcuttiae]